MAQSGARRPNKVYRGTVDEVLSHRSEIPLNAILELRVFDNIPENDYEVGDFGGRSVLEAFPHLFGTEHGGPTDISDRVDEYMQGFGATNAPRTFEP